jgi:hypothetical protein
VTTDEPPILRLTPATRGRLAWLAAGLVIALLTAGAGFAIGGASRDGTVDDLDAQVGQLGDAVGAVVRIDAQPDARHVALVPGPAGDRAAGAVAYSPGAGLLLITATGLAPEPAGYAYRGWIDVNGQPRLLGAMVWAGGAWSWSGTVDGLGTLPVAPAAIHVSLVPDGGSPIGDPVLSGRS